MLYRLCGPFTAVCWRYKKPCSVSRRSLTACKATQSALQPVNELQHQVVSPREDTSVKLLNEHIGKQRLQLRQQHIALDGHELCLIEPADVDAVIDMYIAAGQEERDPYWARPWPSALALGRYILEHRQYVQGKSVCEVGAGLGIATIAALLAGAKSAVVTDREPLALECALRSARASGISGVAADPSMDDSSSASPAPSPSKMQASFLDWNEEYAGPKSDLVLACDVLYEDFSVEPVGNLLPQLLSDTGQILLADPSERTRHNREYFVDMVLGQTARPLLLEECVAVQESMDGKMHSVEIMRFRFRQGSETVGVKTLRR